MQSVHTINGTSAV